MATRNGEKYITRQLDSILSQLGPNDEVIISDDASTDATIELISARRDPRITLFPNPTPLGITAGFENALTRARGEYIFLADQDDVWKENKVRISLHALTTCDVVVSDCLVVDQDLKLIAPSFFEINRSRSGFFRNLRHNAYIGSCMAFRRSLLTRALPFPKHIPMHDLWLGFVAELFCSTRFIPLALILYRRHNSNASSTAQPSRHRLRTKIMFRFNLLRYIPLLLTRKTNNQTPPPSI
jgi:glycosyltransferase involved in cell wall biosynthesis